MSPTWTAQIVLTREAGAALAGDARAGCLLARWTHCSKRIRLDQSYVLPKLGTPVDGQHRFVCASQAKPAPHWPLTHEPTGSAPVVQRTATASILHIESGRTWCGGHRAAQIRLQVAREADTALAVDARADGLVTGGTAHCKSEMCEVG